MGENTASCSNVVCVFARERKRERAQVTAAYAKHSKTYTMPLVNKVVAMPLGANLDCDLRQHRGFLCVCVCVCSLHVSVSLTLDAPLKQ